ERDPKDEVLHYGGGGALRSDPQRPPWEHHPHVRQERTAAVVADRDEGPARRDVLHAFADAPEVTEAEEVERGRDRLDELRITVAEVRGIHALSQQTDERRGAAPAPIV